MGNTREGVNAVHDYDCQAPPVWYRVGARMRGAATLAGLVGLVVGLIGGLALPESRFPEWLAFALLVGGFALLVLGIALTFTPGAPRIPPRSVGPPVAGRWSALNSPASRVPSHGTHGFGQTFAVDLVHEPQDGGRPTFGEGRAFRPPEDFPAFGKEVVAPANGRVVAVRASARDHRSRSTWPAVAYMLLEGIARELAGSRHVLGNFVVLELGDGAYAALAHLQRGSPTVRPGELVGRGEVVGRCGNSGNSSEPHVHFQLMDHPRPFYAAGLPFVFAHVSIDASATRDGVPGNGQVMVA